MGADCSKSHRAKLTSPQFSKQISCLDQMTKSSSLFIHAYTVLPNKVSQQENRNICYYSTYLSLSNRHLTADYVAFIPKLGFKKYRFIQQFKNECNIGFQLHKNDNNPMKLELKTKQQLKLWRKISNEKMIMEEGNQICMGALTIRLRHLMTPEQIQRNKEKSQVDLIKCSDENAQCRICLQKAEDESNPLIMPCNCAGTVSAVHQACLSDWIFGEKVVFTSSREIVRFKIRHGQCQICKHSFENYIWNRIMKALFLFNSTYAIFQLRNVMDKDKKSKDDRDCMIMKLKDNATTIRIGNDSTCEMYQPDNTLSPINTILTYSEGKLMVQDNNSKFGTHFYTSHKYLYLNTSYRVLNLFFTITKDPNPPCLTNQP